MKCIAKFLFFFILSFGTFAYSDEIAGSFYIYTLKKGNTLSEIYKIFGTSEKELKNCNDSKIFTRPSEGKKIKIPLGKKQVTPYKIQKGDSLYSIARKFQITVTTLQKTVDEKIQKNMWINTTIYIPNGNKQNEPIKQLESIKQINTPPAKYKVKPKDTYYGLSKSLGFSVTDLQKLNNNRRLLVGDTILLPKKIIQPNTEKTDIKTNNPKENLLNTAIPYKGKISPPYKGHMNSYSPLVSGITYTVKKNNGKYIFAPISGIITDIKPMIGFGMGIFITHGDTTIILASKGFSNFLTKPNSSINRRDTIAYVDYNYKLYVFMIKNGKVLPPF